MKNEKRYSQKELWEKQQDVAERLGMHKRSITPDTLKEIIFEKSEEDLFYGEYYKHKGNEVTRFGLNISSPELLKVVQEYNANVKGALETKSLTSIASEKSASKNIDTIKNLQTNSANILTKLEFVNTNNAIEYLKTGAKTALVDIFDRDADGKIKMEKDIPETHTVVLYEKLGKYLVIDPSNATFSYILASTHKDMRLCFSNKLQVYKHPEKANNFKDITGPDVDQWRDCIDVAVKLAFSLNINLKLGLDSIKVQELGEDIGYIDYSSLKDSPSVKEITNQNSLYKKLPEMIEKYVTRIKQSSDIVHVKKITTLMKFLEVKLSDLQNLINKNDAYHLNKQFNNKYEKLFVESSNRTPDQYDNTIKDFQDFYYKLQNINEIELLGMEFQSIEEI